MSIKAKKTRKRRPNNMPAKTWNVTEILYAFAGLLNTRQKPLIFGEKYAAAPIAEFLSEFIKVNNLPLPRPDYPRVKVPKGTDHITNHIADTNMKSLPALTGEEAIGEIMVVIRRVSREQHAGVVAMVLELLNDESAARIKSAELNINSLQDMLIAEMKKSRDLGNVTSGNFSVLELKPELNG